MSAREAVLAFACAIAITFNATGLAVLCGDVTLARSQIDAALTTLVAALVYWVIDMVVRWCRSPL